MKKEEIINELEILADSCVSGYALEVNGYKNGVIDAIEVVKKFDKEKHQVEYAAFREFTQWVVFTKRMSTLIDADIPKESKKIILRHFNISSEGL